MSAPRVHRYDSDTSYGAFKALCGAEHGESSRFTRDNAEVTCKLCQRRLAAIPYAPGDLKVEAELRPYLYVDDRGFPRRTRPPTHAEAFPEKHRKARTLFSSLAQALHHYASIKVDGYTSKSVAGAHEKLGRVGAMVQTSGRSIPRAQQEAESAAEVEKSLRWAAAHVCECDESTAIAVLILDQIGKPSAHSKSRFTPFSRERLEEEFEMSAYEIRAVIGEMVRWTRVDLSARGLLPEPRVGRVQVDALLRRRELGEVA